MKQHNEIKVTFQPPISLTKEELDELSVEIGNFIDNKINCQSMAIEWYP